MAIHSPLLEQVHQVTGSVTETGGGDQDPHYKSGRVCALAVLSKGIYISNVVTVPEKLEKAGETHAEELRAGERKAGANLAKRMQTTGGSPACFAMFASALIYRGPC